MDELSFHDFQKIVSRLSKENQLAVIQSTDEENRP